MSIFSKQENSPDPERPRIVEFRKVFKLRKAWSDEEADHIYVLYIGEELEWSDGSRDMQTVHNPYDGWYNPEGWKHVTSGNLSWAEKIAKHYGIQIAEEKES